MICPNCGAQLDDSAIFCTTCGAKLDGFQQQPQQPAAESAAQEPQGAARPIAPEEDEVPPPDPMRELRRSVQEQIQRELLKRMDMKRLTLDGVDREGLEDTARS